MKNFREIEQLSAYLDGQLNASDAARLEARLKTDPELASVLNDLRAARGILRKLPARKSPRNFTLTRQMVGLKPPLPRSYPILRFATVFAAFLFIFSLTANMINNVSSATAPLPAAYGMGGGGGGCDSGCGGGGADTTMEQGAATEAAATEEQLFMESAPAATEAPAAEAPSQDIAPAMTNDTSRIVTTPTPSMKGAPTEASVAVPTEVANQAPADKEAGFSFSWTWLFLGLAIAGGFLLWVMRLTARSKWR